MKKQFDFSKVEKFNEEMTLYFKIDSYLLESKLSEDKNSEIKLEEQEKNLFNKLYGLNYQDLGSISLEKIENKHKKIGEELIFKEDKIHKEFYFYTYQDIKSLSEKPELKKEDLALILDKNLESKKYNLNSYNSDFMYLFAAKNPEGFENIFETLELRKRYMYSDELVIALTGNEESEFLFKNEIPLLIDNYLNSKYGLKSVDQLLHTMSNITYHSPLFKNKESLTILLDKIDTMITENKKDFLNIKNSSLDNKNSINGQSMIRSIIDNVKSLEESIKYNKDPISKFYENENVQKIKNVLNKTVEHLNQNNPDFYDLKQIKNMLNKKENTNRLKM